MRRRWLLHSGLATVFLMAASSPAAAGPAIGLFTGDTEIGPAFGTNRGKFTVTLIGFDGTKRLFHLPQIPKNTSAADKAKMVAAKVNEDNALGWEATVGLVPTNLVTFKYNQQNVARLENIFDSTGEVSRTRVLGDNQGNFDFGLGDDVDGLGGLVSASGVDDDGDASFVRVTFGFFDGGAEQILASSTLSISAGETSAMLSDRLFSELSAQASTGANLDLYRTGLTSFGAANRNPGAFMEFQITDTQVFVSGAGATAIPEPATLTMAGIGMLGLLGFGGARRAVVSHLSRSSNG